MSQTKKKKRKSRKAGLDPIATRAADAMWYAHHKGTPKTPEEIEEWKNAYKQAQAGMKIKPKCPKEKKMNMNDLKKEMEKAWKESFNDDGTVTEQGGSIIKKGDGTYEIRRAKPGASGSIPLENFPKAGPGETLVGTFHTHPYSKDEGGYTGVSFSKGDITNFMDGGQGSEKYVVTGDKFFKLSMEDPAKAKAFDQSQVRKQWDNAFANSSGTFPEKCDQAAQAATKDTGISYSKMDP